ncbi:MAG: hypothetical protein CVV47_03445 [Spirochaetae bacterium HGW-Spirochaetae-3]|jgi:hypothetical protein|nr:MAG: hypothetical protein CVV47_03445 [Spirochaetae bacterium HGW-Spirochaetae-3]
MKKNLRSVFVSVFLIAAFSCANVIDGQGDGLSTTDASLSNLSLSVGVLSPPFAPGTLEYTASVDTSFSTVTLTGTAADAEATLDAKNGMAQDIVDGKNDVLFTVLAADGVTKRVYRIAVTREKDTAAPIVTAFTVSPETIDTTNADVTVGGKLIAQDPSGLDDLNGSLFFKGLKTSLRATLAKNAPESTFTRAVYDWSVLVPMGSTGGSYAADVESMTIKDSLGNDGEFFGRIWIPEGCAKAFTNDAEIGDIAPPDVTGLTVSTQTVDPKDTDVEVTGTLTIEDPSGIRYAKDFEWYYSSAWHGATMTKNDLRSTYTVAVYDWSITIPQGTPPGTMFANGLKVADNADNYKLWEGYNTPVFKSRIITITEN